MMMDEMNKNVDRIYDNDLEYLYMKTADLSLTKTKSTPKILCSFHLNMKMVGMQCDNHDFNELR